MEVMSGKNNFRENGFLILWKVEKNGILNNNKSNNDINNNGNKINKTSINKN